MPVGDCQREFASAASEDGIILSGQSFPWLCQRGHLAIANEAPEAASLLERIYAALGFESDVLVAARPTRLTGDFLHEPSGNLIEIDEGQHFTTARLLALDLYPDELPLGFELGNYRALCERLSSRWDRYRASKDAWRYGPGGRTRQRAYYDALRDIATPAMGHPPLVRIAAPHGDGCAAYQGHRNRLLDLLS